MENPIKIWFRGNAILGTLYINVCTCIYICIYMYIYIAVVWNLEWVKKCKQLIGENLECPPSNLEWLSTDIPKYHVCTTSKCRENRRKMIQHTKLRMPLNPNTMDSFTSFWRFVLLSFPVFAFLLRRVAKKTRLHFCRVKWQKMWGILCFRASMIIPRK